MGGSSADSIAATSRDTNGNLYLAGSTSSFGAGGSDALLLKYDSSGNVLWSKTWEAVPTNMPTVSPLIQQEISM